MSQHAEPAGRFYAFLRLAARFWIWFLFREVAVREAGRVPSRGPVLLCVNHPNNLIDSLLVGGGAVTEGPLPRQRLALPEPDPRPLPGPCRRHPRLPAAGRPGPARSQRRGVRRGPSGSRRRPRARDLSRGHHARRDSRPADQDGGGADRARLRDGASDRPGSQRSGPAPPLVLIPVGLSFEARKSFRGRVLVAFGEPVSLGLHVARVARGAGGGRPGSDRRHPERDGGRGRPRRPDRRRPGGPWHRGSVPQRARPPAPGRAGTSLRGDRRLPPLPRHRRGGRPLQGARSRPARRDLAAHPALPRAPRRVARARPGGGSAAPEGRASPPPALVRRGRARPSGLPLWHRRERACRISFRAGSPARSRGRRPTTRRSASSRAWSPSPSAGGSRPGSSGRSRGQAGRSRSRSPCP